MTHSNPPHNHNFTQLVAPRSDRSERHCFVDIVTFSIWMNYALTEIILSRDAYHATKGKGNDGLCRKAVVDIFSLLSQRRSREASTTTAKSWCNHLSSPPAHSHQQSPQVSINKMHPILPDRHKAWEIQHTAGMQNQPFHCAQRSWWKESRQPRADATRTSQE